MIHFYRKRRQQLMDARTSDKSGAPVRKYIKYAVGEIILVVIGILIALQINNWNDERKNHLWEYQFLKDLKNELETNKAQLEEIHSIQTQKGEAFVQTIALVRNADRSNQSKIDSLYSNTQGKNPTFFPTTGVYDSGLASGKIEHVKNIALKYAIMNLYNHYYKRLIYNGEILDDVVEKVDWEELKFYDNFQKKIKGWESIINPDFLNQLDYQLFRIQIYTRLTKQNLIEIDKVINAITKVLDP